VSVEPRASPAYFNHQTNTGFTWDTSDFCRAISLVTFETSTVARPACQIISKRDDVTEASTVLGRADLTANPRAAAMPQFRYRTVTSAGRIVVDELDAPSRDEVVRRIEYLGHPTIDSEIGRIRCCGRL
jgi:hypothetical protein